jgi:hypothetical protein
MLGEAGDDVILAVSRRYCLYGYQVPGSGPEQAWG